MAESPRAVWERILTQVRRELPEPAVTTWLAPAVPTAFRRDQLTLELPDEFAVKWNEAKHGTLLERIASDFYRRRIAVTFRTSPDRPRIDSFETVSHLRPIPEPPTEAASSRDVFVVHGRNESIRQSLFAFLRAADLNPLEWSQVVADTGLGAPYIGQILDRAFGAVQAVVVLMTPDDEVRLLREFWQATDSATETTFRLQPRANVLFEAGMAFARNPDRTVLVQVGEPKVFSDIHGRHVVRLDNTVARRQELLTRLRTIGCPVNLARRAWRRVGTFHIGSPT